MRAFFGRTPTRQQAAALLGELGASGIPHVNTDLLTHLEGTERILRSWGCPEPLVLAGLCHAAYGTDGFPPALLALERRERLRKVIGREAESLVYRYASCDRGFFYPQLGAGSLTFRDRFTGAEVPAGPGLLGPFADLTVANEYEIYLSVGPGPEGQYLSQLLDAFAQWGCAGARGAADEVRRRVCG